MSRCPRGMGRGQWHKGVGSWAAVPGTRHLAIIVSNSASVGNRCSSRLENAGVPSMQISNTPPELGISSTSTSTLSNHSLARRASGSKFHCMQYSMLTRIGFVTHSDCQDTAAGRRLEIIIILARPGQGCRCPVVVSSLSSWVAAASYQSASGSSSSGCHP